MLDALTIEAADIALVAIVSLVGFSVAVAAIGSLANYFFTEDE